MDSSSNHSKQLRPLVREKDKNAFGCPNLLRLLNLRSIEAVSQIQSFLGDEHKLFHKHKSSQLEYLFFLLLLLLLSSLSLHNLSASSSRCINPPGPRLPAPILTRHWTPGCFKKSGNLWTYPPNLTHFGTHFISIFFPNTGHKVASSSGYKYSPALATESSTSAISRAKLVIFSSSEICSSTSLTKPTKVFQPQWDNMCKLLGMETPDSRVDSVDA